MLPLHSAILGSPTQTLHQWHYNRTTLLLLGTEGPILGPRDTEGPTWSPRQTCLRQFTKYMIAANELASLSRVQMMYLLYTTDKVCTQWVLSLIAVYVSIVYVSPLPDMLCTVCLSFTWHAVYSMSLLYLTCCVCLSFTWHAVYVSPLPDILCMSLLYLTCCVCLLLSADITSGFCCFLTVCSHKFR